MVPGTGHRIVSKAISLWKHTEDSYKLFKIFPGHAVVSWWRMVMHGVSGRKEGCEMRLSDYG